MSILAIILPVIGLIAVGWLAQKTRLVSRAAEEGLTEYVFSIAVPALIVLTLTKDFDSADFSWAYLVAYFSGVAVAWLAGMLLATRLGNGTWKESVLFGFVSAQSNTVLLGIPLIIRVYGDAAAMPMFLLLAVHLPIMMTAVTLMVEGPTSGTGLRTQFAKIGGSLIRNPIVVAMIVGLFLKLTGLTPGGILATLLEGIGKTTATCALLAMGMSLARYNLVRGLTSGLMLSLVKLVIHPLAVWVLAFKLFGLPPVVGGVAVIYAALPSGINSYLVAKRYGAAEMEVSATIILATLLSVVSLFLWLSFLNAQ
ncbi:AEC family transporter [Rhodobium gokarnense]|uniref:Permease n=1 Tax=Rhodobium gokarnense TaxID=364296 RepID=A0ABT3H645_9HYPH|nr:AEC family transporter [Rhodobium gokarnense]MCW2305863.1 putative permease [Rhodobium gokarnense]